MIVYNGKVAAFFERSRTMLSAMLEAELEAYVAELHRSPETLLVVPETNAVEGKLPVRLEEAVYAFIERRRAIFAFVKSTAAGILGRNGHVANRARIALWRSLALVQEVPSKDSVPAFQELATPSGGLRRVRRCGYTDEDCTHVVVVAIDAVLVIGFFVLVGPRIDRIGIAWVMSYRMEFPDLRGG